MNFWAIFCESQFYLRNKPGLWTKEHASDLQNEALADYHTGFAQFTIVLLKCPYVEALLNSAVDKLGKGKEGWGEGWVY